MNQQSMHILHNQIVLYIAHTICMTKRLVPIISINNDFFFFLSFLKTWLEKMHFFKQRKTKSINIVHNSTFYALCMLLLKGTTYYPLFLNIATSKQTSLFLKKTRLFKKCHSFTKSNKQSKNILYDCTFL